MSDKPIYYHIFANNDGEIDERLNVDKKEVDMYLSQTTLQETKYGRVKIFSSNEKLKETKIKINITLEV